MNDKRLISLDRELFPWEKEVLERCGLFLVGGVVRDLLLDKAHPTLDFDYIVSGIGEEDLLALLARIGRADLVGKSFGVIKFKTPEGITVDIALPRSEVSTGPGHRDFKVVSDPDMPVASDLERRDFTVNSMALDLRDSGLVDPLGGVEDLEKRVLRVNRDTSFVEDPLRIMRGVQFLSRFELEVEPGTRALMERDRDLLGTVSKERIRDELNKMMLLADRPSAGFVFMHETGILPLVLPELDVTWGVEQNEFHPDDVFYHSVKSCDIAEKELLIRWCALLHDLGKPMMKMELNGRTVFHRHEEESARLAGEILTRLMFPASFISSAKHLISHHMFMITDEWSDSAVRRFVARVGTENIDDLFEIRKADGASRGDRRIGEEVEYSRNRIDKVIRAESAFKRSDLALTGTEVMEIAGIEPGPHVGEILDDLLEAVLDHPEYNTREKLEELIGERKRA
ncbi:MAG: HD domain-containing protein [Candidatus Krumholzibacteria bacterium]|nr:HD domain-containing protein [Candidatus Krumholzibacteria bacterium]